MTRIRNLATGALLACLVWAAAPVRAEDDLYRAGQEALDEGRYEEAAATFERLVAKGGADVDAGLYWQGYALAKAGRKSQAREPLDRLIAKHPKSEWVDDARALLVDLKAGNEPVLANGDPGPTDDDEEEMKLYALNSLMNTDSPRAVAVLEKFLAKKHSRRLDEQAIFVLSQSDSPGALQLLAKIARGELRPDLRIKAIETLGLAGDDESLRLLQSVYKSGDAETRATVLQAYFLADEAAPVLAAAREESDAELRRKAIEILGLMGEGPALAEMYRAEAARGGPPAVRLKIIEALGLAGDASTLLTIARQDADPGVRAKAIESIAVFGEDDAPGALADLYRGATDRQTKIKILESFIVCDCAAKLIEIARAEKDRDLRRKAIQVLSVMGSDEAADFLLEALDED
jgi:hypothetical protein